jgi:hypothetical protein
MILTFDGNNHIGLNCHQPSNMLGVCASQYADPLLLRAWLQAEKELGLQMHPLHETYIDMVTTLIQRGIAKPVPK